MHVAAATITCPVCGRTASEPLAADRCLYFYDCPGCGIVLRPNPGDCCVFCSYGDRPCPSIQPDLCCGEQDMR